MSMDPEIEPLLEALKVSPDNVPLRLHLAELFMRKERYEEAEKEYQIALKHSPQDSKCLLGLCRAYHRQGKWKVALVIAEDLAKSDHCPGEVLILYSRLLLQSGNKTQAIDVYQNALQQYPELQDSHLEKQLGYSPQPSIDEQVLKMGSDGEFISDQDDEDFDFDLETEKPKVGFNDVGGMDRVKEEIQLKIILPLTNKDLYEAYGKKTGGGILLYGPPGCGKTHIARATAGEVKANFMSVGLNDILDMYIGNSEKRLHEIFEQARSQTPCVLFFDEVDAMGASRSDMRHSAGRQLINQFLSELDGIQSQNEGILILAATNAPWHMDNALRRPGRFDRIIFVPPPDLNARQKILELYLKDKPTEDLQLEKVAKKTEGLSGADLKSLIDHVIEEKLRIAMKSGLPEPIRGKDLLSKLKVVKGSTKEWFSTARNYALYSNQGGHYDDILEYLKIKK